MVISKEEGGNTWDTFKQEKSPALIRNIQTNPALA